MIKNCKYCNKEYNIKPSYYNKSSYCSKECMASDYKTRMSGTMNPNYKDAQNRVCSVCNKKFSSYVKTRKYCSHSCAGKSEQNKKKLKIISGLPRKKRYKKPIETKTIICSICNKEFTAMKVRMTCSKECANKLKSDKNKKDKINNKTCGYCSKQFHSYQKGQIYCSHECSYKDGSSIRGGQGSIKAMKKYGAKKDANHNIIEKYFIDAGLFVKDLSSVGFGIPDLIVWDGNEWQLVEIKNPKTSYGKRGLNKIQKDWVENWRGGKVFVITNLIEAKLFVQKKYHLLDRYPK